MSRSAPGVDFRADQCVIRPLVSRTPDGPGKCARGPNQIAVPENDRLARVDLYHLVWYAMSRMQELPGLGQQNEHVHRRAAARRLIGVHHLPDHSHSSRAVMPSLQVGPSDRHCSFIVHLSRGFQFGQIVAHIQPHESDSEEHGKCQGAEDCPKRDVFLFSPDRSSRISPGVKTLFCRERAVVYFRLIASPQAAGPGILSW
jgi:hypothetical protein